MADRSVIVSFITKLNRKGLQQAEKGLSSLGKSAMAMGMKTKLAFLLSGTAATYFAQQQMSQAIKATVEEEKALLSLQQTLKNVGSAFSLAQVDSFVGSLEKAFAISDDLLRPALQQLITVTGDVASSQELLKIAIDVSKGSGKDLLTVTTALSRAYGGQLTALGKLNVGLDRSKLKAGDLDGAILELSNKFEGQGAVAAAGLAGQLDGLRISADKARENLGVGLVEALKVATGDKQSGFAGLGSQLESLGTRFGNVAIGLGAFVRRFKEILKPLALVGLLLTPVGKVLVGLDLIFGKLEKSGEKIRKQRDAIAATKKIEDKRDAARAGQVQSQTKTVKLTTEQLALQKKLQEQEAKTNAAKDAERRKALEEARRAGITSDLAAKFDIDGINLSIAAGRAKTEEEKAAVAGLQALRTEGYKDDETALNKLMQLDKMRADRLRQEASDLSKLNVMIPVDYYTRTSPQVAPGRATDFGLAAPSAGMQPRVAPGRATDFGLAAPMLLNPELRMIDRGAGAEAVQVYVSVQGNVFTEQELTQAIASGLYELQRSGQNTTLTNLGR